MKYLIKQSAVNKQFHVVAKARNGEPLNSSEQFPHKKNAFGNIYSTIEHHTPKDGTLFTIFDYHAGEKIVVKYLDGSILEESRKKLTAKQRANV